MKRGKLGFTLIEVAIFLVITGALFISVAVGVQNSIYQQRTNDSIQNFMEFLRTAYAEVTDVQNTGGGRSEQAIYGKLITFGESRNLAGETVTDENEFFAYTVIGDIGDSNGQGTFEALKVLNANVIREVTNDEGEKSVDLVGITESYLPKWATRIEPACDGDLAGCKFEQLKGMMLIVRHPNSGTVTTMWSDDLVEVNSLIERIKKGESVSVDVFSNNFELKQIDFCINTTGEEANVRNRADVRVIKGARNASGIELVASDMEGYKCGE
ncbi:type II secretion system protein [Candidatus Saccharibacteria bacterium]|nr:type II secretion system protein [Candidatus Saccharibacteria bacterium]